MFNFELGIIGCYKRPNVCQACVSNRGCSDFCSAHKHCSELAAVV